MTAATDEHPRAVELRSFVADDYRQVVGAVTLITGDRAVAEDAVQEALAKAWRARHQPIERLAAWITVVASNEARSRRRRQGSEERALARAHRQLAGTAPADDSESPVDPELMAALAALPLRERQATVLHYVADLSVNEVAAQLGISDGTVKTLLSRARGHLASALQADSTGGVA